ncbi:hypothetical protein RJ641_031254 [Dillenia turbinata]|uniref:Uncharacterized protein n=1 Tax=Dillenia turbinata TaxID=194707 RepID=A0AAN8VX70_9MAGN
MPNRFRSEKKKGRSPFRLGKIMKCIFSGEQLGADEIILSSESLATKDYSVGVLSSTRPAVNGHKPDTGNIEEAELSLRESGSLNYEEARALLGRYEYQKGNIEAALHVFEGIDIAAVTPKMKLTLAKRGERRRRPSQSDAIPLMSIHAASLLLEAIYLKARSLQGLKRFKEAAQSCKLVLDIVESSLPDGLPENFGADCKLQETINKAVELLPELWKLANSPGEAILSYRRALLHKWNLDLEIISKIEKEFAIFLLYSGGEVTPPNLRSQMDSSFVPKNNIEEAILLLMILLRKISLKKINGDPLILDHLVFALSISGELGALGKQVEELLPGIMDRKERYYTLALCYYAVDDGLAALNLLRKLLSHREDPNNVPAMFLASKICGENPNFVEEGVDFARRALAFLKDGCRQRTSIANTLLGISLSAHAKSVVTDSERIAKQNEALQALETAARMTQLKDHKFVYQLCLESAEQRKLDVALYCAKRLLKLEGGSNAQSWILLARILSAQKRFLDAEAIINVALDQMAKWDQGELLRTKAKVQMAQGQLKNAIGTYTELLAILQVQTKSFGSAKRPLKGSRSNVSKLEQETWHDLAHIYISLKQWSDAEICLSKSKAISPWSAGRLHAKGALHEAKGCFKDALNAFRTALDIEPKHVPSLVSMAVVLRRVCGDHSPTVRSFLMEAIRLDRMNSSAWHTLGLLYKSEGASSAQEAAECFEAASALEETAPVETFR